MFKFSKLYENLLVFIISNFLTYSEYILLIESYSDDNFLLKLQQYPIFKCYYFKETYFSSIISVKSNCIRYGNIKFDLFNTILDYLSINGIYLTIINLSDTMVTDYTFSKILIYCQNIESLNISCCGSISNRFIYYLTDYSKKLRYLDIVKTNINILSEEILLNRLEIIKLSKYGTGNQYGRRRLKIENKITNKLIKKYSNLEIILY